jgi:urate oxidase
MSARLAWNGYGKADVRLVKVDRTAPRHELHDLTIDVQLQGGFETAHTEGDNSQVLPTDTMKNTVYALARQGAVAPPEPFAERLARRLLEACPSARRAVIGVSVHAWQRAGPAFVRGTAERRLVTVTLDEEGLRFECGLEGLGLLKTADSAFSRFLRDQYTTLREADDRILATDVEARWTYVRPPADFDAAWTAARTALVETFALHRSASVQHTLYAMGEAALGRCAEIDEIRLVLPNRHHHLVDLTPFGLDNPNEIFVATAEPYGRIEAVLARDP